MFAPASCLLTAASAAAPSSERLASTAGSGRRDLAPLGSIMAGVDELQERGLIVVVPVSTDWEEALGGVVERPQALSEEACLRLRASL